MALLAMAIEELTLARGWGRSRRRRTTLLCPYLYLHNKQKRCCHSGKGSFRHSRGKFRLGHPLPGSKVEHSTSKPGGRRMSSAPDHGRTCSQPTQSQHRSCLGLGLPFSEPTPMTARHYMTLMRCVVLLLLIAAFALSAQLRVGDSLENQYRRLNSEPTCRNAVELFQVVDDMVAKAINERGPARQALKNRRITLTRSRTHWDAHQDVAELIVDTTVSGRLTEPVSSQILSDRQVAS